MLSDFWFSLTLEPESEGSTRVCIETHYDPKGLAARMMSVLMLRRKFRQVRESALTNLKRLAESVDANHVVGVAPPAAPETG